MIEKDHLCDWSPEKDCWWLMLRRPVRGPSSESGGGVGQLKVQKPWWAIRFLRFRLTGTAAWLWGWLPHGLSRCRSLTAVLLRTPVTQIIFFNHGMLLLGSNHFLKNNNYHYVLMLLKTMGIMHCCFKGFFRLANKRWSLDISPANLRFWLANAESDRTCWLGSSVMTWNIKYIFT